MLTISTSRIADAPHLAAIHNATWREAYRGILRDSYLDRLDTRRLTLEWRSQLLRLRSSPDEAIYVARGKLGAVGFVTVCPGRRDDIEAEGEISMLYVLADYRRHGLGRRLMRAAAAHCIRRGFFTAGLWVLKENHRARAFYETCGGIACAERQDMIGGAPAPLVGYRWDDIAALAGLETRQIILPDA